MLEDCQYLSKIVEFEIKLHDKTLKSMSEVCKNDFDLLLDVLQSVTFGILDNAGNTRMALPRGLNEFVKNEYNKFKKSEGTTPTDKVKTKLRSSILEDEKIYYDLIGKALLGKDVQKDNRLNELFIFKLKSKYKNIGEQYICVYFENDDSFIIIEGKAQKINLVTFIENFFGKIPSGCLENYDCIVEKIKNSNEQHSELQHNINEFCSSLQKSLDEDFSLVSGAVMFCDFLGWKGLWKNDKECKALKDASSLVEKIRKKFNELVNTVLPLNRYFPVNELISISDTIALLMPKVQDVDNEKLFELFSEIGKYILEESILIYPLRGAFTLGDFNYNNNIMIGPAIDEAASWHEAVDWIGIILAPTAQFEYDLTKKPSVNICEYKSIPLKNIKTKIKYCVKWCEPQNAIIDMVRWNKSLIPEIASKYINTSDFLKDISLTGDNKDE